MAINYTEIIESIKERLEEDLIDYEQQINKEKFGDLHVFITEYGKGFCLQPKKKIVYYVLDKGIVSAMKKEGFKDSEIEDGPVWIETTYYKFCDYLIGKKVDFSLSQRVPL